MTGRRTQTQNGIALVPPMVHCAVYTRKSTDENLDSDFNSLDAQREAAESYINSQRHQGWVVLPERYDDGAYSGGNLERPALQRLLADIHAGRVDAIVVYKIDRLSRSLLDFARLMEDLEQNRVILVSVTQQFSTSTSMGILLRNILLSFAQFEREVTAERIRDKIAAEKRRGKYLGGVPPLGYGVDRERKRLVVNDEEAALVRLIFHRYLELRSFVALGKELNASGHLTKSWTTKKGKVRPGRAWNKAHIYRLLTNPTYIGLTKHKDKRYPGLHEAVVEQPVWDQVQAALTGNSGNRGKARGAKKPALLKGIIRCGHCGTSMGVTFTRKDGRTYRYYLCLHANKNGYAACPVKTVSAGTVENAVTAQLRAMLRCPEEVGEILQSMQKRRTEERRKLGRETTRLNREIEEVKAKGTRLLQDELDSANGFVREELARLEARRNELEDQLRRVEWELESSGRTWPASGSVAVELARLDDMWDDLFPAEHERIVRLLVEDVVVCQDHLEVVIRPAGLCSVADELMYERGQDATSSTG